MEKHFVATSSNGGALYPGKPVLVTDLDRGVPVPDFVLQHCEPCVAPAAGSSFIVNAREYAASQRLPPAPPPDRLLTKEELWKKCKWTSDPKTFELATAQHNFPRPIAQTSGNNLLSVEISCYAWSERAVDRWVNDQRAKLEQLRVFVG